MASHLSPSPWTTDAECGDESVLDADGFMVADCAIFGDCRQLIDNRANARAIALVPDLIEYAARSASNGCVVARALIDRLSPTIPATIERRV